MFPSQYINYIRVANELIILYTYANCLKLPQKFYTSTLYSYSEEHGRPNMPQHPEL